MKKRLASLALALVMVLALLPATAFAADATPVKVGNITFSDVIITDEFDTAWDAFGTDKSMPEREFLYNLGTIGFWHEDIEEWGLSTFWCYLLPKDATILIHTTKKIPQCDIYAYTLEEIEGSLGSRRWLATWTASFDATLDVGASETDFKISKEFIEDYAPEFGLLRIVMGEEDFLIWFGNPAFAFTDVPSWFEKEVSWAVEKKITNGYGSSTTFAPNVECPHTQILTFLWRAADRPAASAAAPFTVAASYQDAVNWAYEEGLIDDSFNPDALCTRADAVRYIWLALGSKKAAETASFSDVDADAPYIDAVSWAVEKGVTNGYGGSDTFAPDRVCNRGEIAAFLYRAYN